ncbi:MAG: phage tail protein [Oscillospiraceae bacterium]
MAGNIKKYVLGKDHLKRSLMDGFVLNDKGVLQAGEEKQLRHIFLKALDGVDDDINWGRLSLKTSFEGDMVLTVRAIATSDPIFIRRDVITSIDGFLQDPDISPSIKEQFFGVAEGIEVSGFEDVLLYKLKGRYLYLWLELSGVGSAEISDLRVYVPGDNFLETFPEVYQSENDFFRRYLSVLSTLYNELQEQIDHLDSVLDVETATVPALHHFSSWLGVDTLNSRLKDEELRRFIKALPELLSLKGTKKAIEKLISLFVTEPFYVIERNLLTNQQLSDNMYGSTVFDFTILINRKADGQLQNTLEYFTDMFKPLRSRYRIIFFGETGGLDDFTFMDFDSTVLESDFGKLDDGRALTGMTYLK